MEKYKVFLFESEIRNIVSGLLDALCYRIESKYSSECKIYTEEEFINFVEEQEHDILFPARCFIRIFKEDDKIEEKINLTVKSMYKKGKLK